MIPDGVPPGTDGTESAGQPGVPAISDREFALFRTLIQRTTGIHLSDAKKTLLVGRLMRRLRDLGFTSFREYYDLLLSGDEEERVRMTDCITTNETRFFRELQQFEFLGGRLCPEWRSQAKNGQRMRRVRAWCAGCSTGEEPYSVAMTLLHHLPPGDGWAVEVLATDLSSRVLDHARRAVWPAEKVSEVPPEFVRPYFLRGLRSQEGRVRIAPEVRAVVRFDRLNLSADHYAVSGQFDLIFCRNVLIYFDDALKVRVVDRLLDHLAPAGYLFTGHAEGLIGVTPRVRSVMPTVYVLADPVPARNPA